MKLLHLDDNIDDLELTRLRLRNLDPGLDIVSCESAAAALEKIRSEEIDCVISDYQMPDTDGIEFLIMLRNNGWSGPFIFFTGQGNENLVVRALRAGADDYFTKDHGNSQHELLLTTICKLVRMHKHFMLFQQPESSLDRDASVNATIAELSVALIESTPVDDIAHLVLSCARRLMKSAFGFVGYIDPKSKNLVCPTFTRGNGYINWPEGESDTFQEHRGLWGWVLENNQPLMTNTAKDDPRASGIPEGHLPIERFLAAPALSGDKPLGIVALANPPKDYTERDLQLLERIAAMYSLAVQREQNVLEQQESEEKYRTLFETMEQGVIYQDEFGVVFSANPSAGKIMCRPTEKLIGCVPGTTCCNMVKENGEPLGPGEHPSIIALLDGKVVSGVIGILDHDDNRRWVLVNSTPQFHPGEKEPLQVFSTLTDITECKLAEIELERSRDRLDAHSQHLESVNAEFESFSHSVSHDLKTPLRAISGFTDLLLAENLEQLDETGRAHLQNVHSSVSHMSVLIEGLLELAKASKGELHRTSVNLSDHARRISALLAEGDSERHVEFEIEEGVVVEADERLVRIVLENLLSNAWKFTGKRSETRIEFGVAQQNGSKVCYVRDNGAGFETRNAERLFAPFKRLHRTNDFPGNGIGLATVKRIIDRHGGTIWGESEPGEGATFFFTLG